MQISHHKAIGKPNWGRVGESLARLDAAREAGLDIDADVYPYTAFSTILGPLLPEVERF
ncbi:MAG: D-aminoacylase, partial [Gemmatimonadetes bacterium]|nr:D-aminoacylase [Gemmatimonadota bacterium]